MIDPVSLGLQAVAAGTTLASSWIIGNKKVLGPVLGVVGSLAFGVLSIYLHLWLILPLNILTAAINTRNTIKWCRE